MGKGKGCRWGRDKGKRREMGKGRQKRREGDRWGRGGGKRREGNSCERERENVMVKERRKVGKEIDGEERREKEERNGTIYK